MSEFRPGVLEYATEVMDWCVVSGRMDVKVFNKSTAPDDHAFEDALRRKFTDEQFKFQKHVNHWCKMEWILRSKRHILHMKGEPHEGPNGNSNFRIMACCVSLEDPERSCCCGLFFT